VIYNKVAQGEQHAPCEQPSPERKYGPEGNIGAGEQHKAGETDHGDAIEKAADFFHRREE
jgi:hypothetical protein